ncbi:MAG: hypothetical protein AB1374_04660 [Bacillota bacterium]
MIFFIKLLLRYIPFFDARFLFVPINMVIANVNTYVRNDHLDFTIPYEWQGVRHEYRPDYLVWLKHPGDGEIKVILEVKGFETEKDRQMEAAAKRWVRAVNHHGEFGRWAFVLCREPQRLGSQLGQVFRA